VEEDVERRRMVVHPLEPYHIVPELRVIVRAAGQIEHQVIGLVFVFYDSHDLVVYNICNPT
jgi:hypothetical protein